MDERIVSVEGVSKSYRIWISPWARLWNPACHWLAELPLWPEGWKRALRAKADTAWREFRALDDVSFVVQRGESVGIVGRNGAGKSTLLQIVTGTLQPTGGTVEVRGRVAALLELGSGFNPEFTGRENVRLNAALHGLDPTQIEERMASMLLFADIGDFVDQPVKTYSSGMMLRLAFAVVAHLEADILIVDEALAVGDVFFVQKCMAFLRRFQERGVLLLVSHSAAAVTALCQKALWLDGGRVRGSGTAKEVTEAYLEAYFEEDAAAKRTLEAAGELVAESPQNRMSFGGQMEQSSAERHDQRLDVPDVGADRNEIEVSGFDVAAAAFGQRVGEVTGVTLTDERGRALRWIVGGEVVTLRVDCRCAGTLRRPVIGFYVKNNLGQQLFGENTFAAEHAQDLADVTGGRLEARFTFQMPILPPGDFVITVALADGTQADHVMQHWIHDALAFRSVSSPMRAGGLIGLPMLDVNLRRIPQSEEALTGADACG